MCGNTVADIEYELYSYIGHTTYLDSQRLGDTRSIVIQLIVLIHVKVGQRTSPSSVRIIFFVFFTSVSYYTQCFPTFFN